MNVIVFGATGMVGQGVLRECLRNGGIEQVLVISRGSAGITHAKLHELIWNDLFDFAVPDDILRGYDACLFCLGVSSAGMSEADYTRVTYDLTLGWGRRLAAINPAMTFVYVSGTGTGGKAMWARVKGRTEAALLNLFPSAYMIRLGILWARHGETSRTRATRIVYALFGPLFPLLHAVVPGAVITTEELGRGMIRAARERPAKRILTNRDLRALASPR